MRKKTAPQIRKNREASPRKPSGLIAQDLSAQQSATLDCVLDNRSHRTRSGLTSLSRYKLVCSQRSATGHSLAHARKSRRRRSITALPLAALACYAAAEPAVSHRTANRTPPSGASPKNHGQGGIRTHGTLAGTPVFETGRFNRSRTCPDD